jgi:argininosuccinate lyase
MEANSPVSARAGAIADPADACLAQLLLSLGRTMLERARAGEDELTVLCTHAQPANVSTMTHYLTGFILDLLEGTESPIAAMRSTDYCTLGACAITGTGFAIDRDRT